MNKLNLGDDQLMTMGELAEKLKVSRAGLYTRLKAGTVDIPYFRVGASYRFIKSDVEDWLSGQIRTVNGNR